MTCRALHLSLTLSWDKDKERELEATAPRTMQMVTTSCLLLSPVLNRCP
jgi:hypothetical protein